MTEYSSFAIRIGDVIDINFDNYRPGHITADNHMLSSAKPSIRFTKLEWNTFTIRNYDSYTDVHINDELVNTVAMPTISNEQKLSLVLKGSNASYSDQFSCVKNFIAIDSYVLRIESTMPVCTSNVVVKPKCTHYIDSDSYAGFKAKTSVFGIIDIVSLLRFLLDKTITTNERINTNTCGDYNADGSVNIIDLISFMRYLLNKIGVAEHHK